MADIATSWNGDAFAGDWAMCGGDLETDAGLRTAVAISLLTDRLAEPDDVLPDLSTNRRGWWGDMPLEGGEPEYRIGSRLWLLTRAKATEDTRRRAIAYAHEALDWLIADGVAERIEVEAEYRALGFLAMRVRLVRGARVDNRRWDATWAATFADHTCGASAIGGSASFLVLGTEGGFVFGTDDGMVFGVS